MTSDPRVFFASERTLLAWVRTGIAIVGLGFIVSKFGLFLRLMMAERGNPGFVQDAQASNVLGVCFVVLGALSIAVAAVQHGRFITSLPVHDRPASYSRSWAIWIAGLLALASLALSGYLMLTLRHG